MPKIPSKAKGKLSRLQKTSRPKKSPPSATTSPSLEVPAMQSHLGSTSSLQAAPFPMTSEAHAVQAASHPRGEFSMSQEPWASTTSDSLAVADTATTLNPAATVLDLPAPMDLTAMDDSEEHAALQHPTTGVANTLEAFESSVALRAPTALEGPHSSSALVVSNQVALQLPVMIDARSITVKAPVFNIDGASGQSVNNNVVGDQHISFTSSEPHALELLKMLNPVTMDAFLRPTCLEGTRDAILQSLIRDLTTLSPGRTVLWLSGFAGSGKSTLATTIAERLRAAGQIGAFLFFDRDSPAQSGPDGVVRTMAYQLALSSPSLRDAICDVIERDPQIGTRTLTTQFDDLIKTPLNSCGHQVTGPVVIVLDAFDECGDAKARRVLLHLLVKELPLLPNPFRFLITSRPEFDLNNSFRSQKAIKAISLGSSEWASAPDVLLYIEHEMDGLYQTRRESDELPPDWPGKLRIHELGGHAADSFIWAATAMRYLHDADDVDECLGILLEQQAFTLGDLYATALRSACKWNLGEASTENCRKILGAVVVGRIAITDDTVVDILGLESAKSCRLVLRKLGCLLQWSEGLPIRTLHASFADYLTSAASCGDEPWYIDPTQHHLDFTTGCLRTMKRLLCFNICKLETSYRMNRDIEDLSNRIEKFIPRSLAYACRFWAEHLSLAKKDDQQILLLILDFFRNSFLYWLEAISLLGEGRSALQAMLHAESYSERHHEMTGEIVVGPLEGHGGVINAVAYSPDGMRIAAGYDNAAVRIWDTQTGDVVVGPLTGHTRPVTSVAYSADGKRIASGSKDHTVRVWDAQTGDAVGTPMAGHADIVNAVAFSPDGNFIASGSDDRTIRIWEAHTGKCVAKFEGHTRGVKSVTFSPDGDHIVSGSADDTVRLWNSRTGAVVRTFEGHTGTVTSVAVSPDGLRIVSGSDDYSVRMWDLQTGTLIALFQEHTEYVTSVSFSPDGLHIASGSYDGTVCIWDARSRGTSSGSLMGHTESVNSVVFSPDGKHIASGSADHTICIWDAFTGQLAVGPLIGHKHSVTSVAFSPNGLHIASGSQDASVCLWDARSGELLAEPFKGRDHFVASVAFSPDGRHIVSGSYDSTVCVRNAQTGVLVTGPLEGHTGWVFSVAYSPDGKHIASGSKDKTVCIWDAQTGDLLVRPLMGHTHWVTSISFSPDGQHIVSGSWDETIRIWDTRTGVFVKKFRGHTHLVQSVAFSPDGGSVVSGSNDQTVRLWDVQTGASLVVHHRHTGPVNSVAFSPDGTRIVSGSSDKTIRIHPARAATAPHASRGFQPTSQLVSGWMQNSPTELLFWVPPTYRAELWWPDSMVIGKRSVHLDLTNFVHGEDWTRCHI
ncbi:hypothetical protein HWV62_42737 [Athelia sp. TMB]|nr:hypothetical protein HWV62_42737 [Athelia sp. TMB]